MSEYIEHEPTGRSVGLVEKKYYTFAYPPNALKLECGVSLGPVTLAYETYGELNSSKDNAVLILHAFSGDSHVAGIYSPDDTKPGWWDFMVGPEKGIDTEHYFVVCINILGSCMGSTGPSTVNQETGEPFALNFPMVTIGDMVVAQNALIEELGITSLRSVIGGSVGGMQALEWSIRYPV